MLRMLLISLFQMRAHKITGQKIYLGGVLLMSIDFMLKRFEEVADQDAVVLDHGETYSYRNLLEDISKKTRGA